MILIADSGSTKTDWAIVTASAQPVVLSTQGINPIHQSREQIVQIIREEFMGRMGSNTDVQKLRSSSILTPDFPYAADLELVVRMSDRLTMEMRTTNVGTVPFSFSEGFQPYFAVGRYDAVKLSGVKAEPFAAVDGMDAAFPRLGDAFAMSDAAVGREISAVAHGNTSVIVWSPGNVEPHNRNLAAGDTERFIGLGPASRVKEGAVTLPPGASHTLSLGLSCRSLSR